jgi:hypothetical protein
MVTFPPSDTWVTKAPWVEFHTHWSDLWTKKVAGPTRTSRPSVKKAKVPFRVTLRLASDGLVGDTPSDAAAEVAAADDESAPVTAAPRPEMVAPA